VTIRSAGFYPAVNPDMVTDLIAVMLGDLPALRWQDRALCSDVDGDLFFPEKGMQARTAKKVCAACPVRAECLEYALKHGVEDGIWGGLSPEERAALRRERRAAA
jgi:WhiB family transcriptional regulator, redox-sensing transcriptional regulator